jgi:hypothetical protein
MFVRRGARRTAVGRVEGNPQQAGALNPLLRKARLFRMTIKFEIE